MKGKLTFADGFGTSCELMGMESEDSPTGFKKHMEVYPRRIAKIVSGKYGRNFKHAASTYPVHNSPHPSIVRNIIFQWEL
ncbi:hypothetical protein [Arenibacter sp. ARW7G5Y1]|uniref:hypothetical protein n=1 Tax=Arenibacter sp. ARW7G5Y1 TaxID=2135619 RepID=UPI000D82562B|nr:hypothetical protein [Arenibacter sp. ARW7G5Y1]PXX24247.1 hypothetical protein C7972_11649 [Arenibacter sp. ARW7G5Y1]